MGEKVKVEYHTLYWTNSNMEQINAHKQVMSHFNIPINYCEETVNHGLWMDRVMRNANSDIVVFFDSDCVPINKEKIMECIDHVTKTKTFLGIAQVSNHIPPRSHIYAAPAFYAIYKSTWQQINTSFTETRRSDVGEEISYRAEDLGIRYRCLFPSTFEREPVEGIWTLGNYGYYGIGTTFADTVYHLYQGRMGTNMQLFLERCQQIVNGTFDNSTHINARTLDYTGRIVR